MPKIQTFKGYKKFDSTCDFSVGDILTGKVRKGGTILKAVSQGEPEPHPFPVSKLSPDPDEWKNIKAEVVSVSDDGKITVIKWLEVVGGIFNQLIALQTDDPEEKYPFRVDKFEVDEYELETVE